LENDTHKPDPNGSAESIAERLFPPIKRTIPQEILRSHQPVWIKNEELVRAENSIRSKRYTGPDNINFRVFTASFKFIRHILYEIAKMSFAACHIPTHCHQTIGNAIPKKQPGKFRIVHIATPLAAFLEIVALNRLEYALSINKLRDDRQYGFTAHRGRHDLVAKIIESTLKHRHAILNDPNITPRDKRRHNQTSIITIDISGAFDNVDQHLILSKMYSEMGNHAIIHWIKEFVLHREIQIKVNNKLSSSRTVNKGVPQGSALGPILWNFAISSINKVITTSQSTHLILLYADDMTIIAHGGDHATTQRLIDRVLNFLKSHKLDVNHDKTESLTILGPTGAKPVHPADIPCFTVNQNPIQKRPKITLLGIPIKDNLTIDTDDETLNGKIDKNTLLLRHLKIHNLIESLHEWRILYDSLIISLTSHNLAPMLIIDHKARKWCDQRIHEAISQTLGWAKNLPKKLPRIALDLDTTTETVQRYIARGAARYDTTVSKTYAELMKIGTLSSIREQINSLSSAQQQCANNKTIRHHPNPRLCLSMTDYNEGEFCRKHTIWLLTNTVSKGLTTIIATCNMNHVRTIISCHNIYNKHYAVDYYNQLSALWAIGQSNLPGFHLLLINGSSSLAAATGNLNTRNPRIIRIRELLAEKSIEIVRTPANVLQAITISIIGEQAQGLTIPIKGVDWPNASRNQRLNIATKNIDKNKQTRQQAELPRQLGQLRPAAGDWKGLPIHQLPSTTLLMLSGMVSDLRGNLGHGFIGAQHPGCNCKREENQPSSLIHRIMSCEQWKKALGHEGGPLNRLRNLIGDHEESCLRLGQAVCGKLGSRHQTSALILLTKIAFTHKTEAIPHTHSAAREKP